jgi:hypothetical protein
MVPDTLKLLLEFIQTETKRFPDSTEGHTPSLSQCVPEAMDKRHGGLSGGSIFLYGCALTGLLCDHWVQRWNSERQPAKAVNVYHWRTA